MLFPPGSLLEAGAFGGRHARIPRERLEFLPLGQAGSGEGLKPLGIHVPGSIEKPAQRLDREERFIRLLHDESRARRRVTLKLRPEPGQLRPAGLPKDGGCNQNRRQQDDGQPPESAACANVRIVLNSTLIAELLHDESRLFQNILLQNRLSNTNSVGSIRLRLNEEASQVQGRGSLLPRIVGFSSQADTRG